MYTGELTGDMSLDSIYETFNLYHPEDFKGHSLSVGDIIVIRKAGKDQAYFVDVIGFKELPDFGRLPERKPVKEADRNMAQSRKKETKGKEAPIRL